MAAEIPQPPTRQAAPAGRFPSGLETAPPTQGSAAGGGGAGRAGSGAPDDASRAEVRPPTAEDARHIVELVRRVPELDTNSPYAYLLLCAHFGDTGIVRWEAGRLVAFVLGYCLPARPDTYFLWQVGVDPGGRGRGLAGRTVIELLRRLEASGVRFLEATVTPSNEASAALFRGVARRLEAPCEERPLFGRELFPPGDDHEEEILFRVGPWPSDPSHPRTREEPRR